MADWKEKDLPTPSASGSSAGAINSEAQTDASVANLSAVPKRKPVPISTTRDGSESIDVAAEVAPLRRDGAWRRACWAYWDSLPDRKLIIVGSVVAAVIVLALVIGLAVGLSRRSADLPLPTAHGGPYKGQLTYYDPGLGACGIYSTSSEMICAVSHVLYDAASTGPNPNNNPLCGLKIRIKRNNRSVDVKVVDRCVGCKVTDLDVSEAVFKQLAPLVDGRVDIEWSWLENASVKVP